MNDDASCSSSSNALSQISKQFTRDKSLHQEGTVGRPGPSLPTARNAFRAPASARAPQEPNLVNEFLQSEDHSGRTIGPSHFDLVHGRARMQGGPGQVMSGEGWSSEFMDSRDRIHELGPEEVEAFEKAFTSHPSHPPSGMWGDEFERFHAQGHSTEQALGPEEAAEFEAAFQQHQSWESEFTQQNDPMGKGKARENVTELNDVDWTRQFEQLDLQSKTEADIAASGLESEDEISRRFEELWKEKSGIVGELDDDPLTADLGDPESWASEFTRSLPSGPYTFEQDNPYLTHEDPYAEARSLRESGGSLQEAALAYEASVQRDSHALDAEAWMFLGQVQAENEKETAAIRALERAVELDDACLPAYTSLAVSYVNEGYDQQAYATLESWIRRRFPDIPIPDGAVAPMDLRARVIDAYLTAARQGPQSPEGGSVDADVQLGLGVLLYGGGEFDKAVDCFVAALEVRPEDYLLWNRLGATLANSGRSEEAINAYHRALDLRPSFVRARYNLGVSCINIGCHREAAEHFLGALSMHGDGQTTVNVSNSLWETLRRVFYMMERRDLAEMAHPGADIQLFRKEFDF